MVRVNAKKKKKSTAKQFSPLRTEIVFTQTWRRFYARRSRRTYPNSGLGEVCPHGNFFSGAHIRVTVPLESGFQLLQLLAGEMSPLPPLLLLLRIIRVPVIAPLFCAPLLLCGSQIKAKSMQAIDSRKTDISPWKFRLSIFKMSNCLCRIGKRILLIEKKGNLFNTNSNPNKSREGNN